MIHGAGGNNLLWKTTLEGLSGVGTAYAVNLPGHPTGETTCRSVAEYSDAVHGFIKDAGLRRPVVAGHSMGGAVALTLALDHPEDASALVLVGTGAKLGVLPEILSGLEREPLEFIERTITPFSFFKVDLEIARHARSALSISNPPIFLNDYMACRAFDVRSRLQEIKPKTLIFCGESDQMTPPRWSHFLHANILGSSVFFIREAGHMVPLEKGASCGGLMQSFLSSLSP